MTLVKPRKKEILLIEDNDADIELFREAFENTDSVDQINVVCDGDEALDYVYRRGGYASSVRPDLVFLDLNLPKTDGYEVLRIMKSDDNLRSIPIIVFTGSDAARDVASSYKLLANCFITKPTDVNQFFEIAEQIKKFWIDLIVLP